MAEEVKGITDDIFIHKQSIDATSLYLSCILPNLFLS
jgi:hypothetical protein